MGRQNGEASVASSSIALLQERFRELQRIRDKRKEKELLKLFSSSSSSSSSESERSSRNSSPSMHFDQQHQSSKLTVQTDHQMTFPHRAPALQDSLLCLRLNSSQTNNNNHPDIRGIKGTPTSLWPNSGSSSRNFENSDVDTSLHL